MVGRRRLSAQAVERACGQQREQPPDALIEAKTMRMDGSCALYAIAAELNTTELLRDASERMRTPTIAMPETVADAKFADLPMVALT